MTPATRLGVLGACCASLAACDPAGWTLAGIAVDVGLHGYQLAGKVTGGIAQGIEIECRAWLSDKAVAVAKGGAAAARAATLDRYTGATAFCDPANPPPADPVAGAFWLGTVIAKL